MMGCYFYSKARTFLFIQIVLMLLFGSIAIASEVDPNLVGWWKFDEGGGGIAYDSSGYENHCTLQVNEVAFSDLNYTKMNGFVQGVSGMAFYETKRTVTRFWGNLTAFNPPFSWVI